MFIVFRWRGEQKSREKQKRDREEVGKRKTNKIGTLSEAIETPAAMETKTCLSASTGLISARTVETYCGLTAMKMMSEDWTTCFYDEVWTEEKRRKG